MSCTFCTLRLRPSLVRSCFALFSSLVARHCSLFAPSVVVAQINIRAGAPARTTEIIVARIVHCKRFSRELHRGGRRDRERARERERERETEECNVGGAYVSTRAREHERADERASEKEKNTHRWTKRTNEDVAGGVGAVCPLVTRRGAASAFAALPPRSAVDDADDLYVGVRSSSAKKS